MKFVSMVRDALRFAWYRRRYDFDNQVPGCGLDFGKLKQICISKIDGKLGDTVVISPLFEALKRRCPQLKICVLTSAALAPLYQDFLKADQVIVLPKRPSAQELDAAAAQMGHCELLLTLEANFRFQDFYLVHKLRPEYVAGVCRKVKAININLDRPDSHVTDYWNRLLQQGGITDEVCNEYTLFTMPKRIEQAKAYCVPGQILLCPWGASKHKHLKDSVVAKLAKTIVSQTGAPVALMVPPDGRYLHELLARELPPEKLVPVPDKLDIQDLCAIAKLSRAAVTVDTAYVHIACAAKIPLYALYNGNNSKLQKLWSPLPNKKDAVCYSLNGSMIDRLRFKDLALLLEMFLKSLPDDHIHHVLGEEK